MVVFANFLLGNGNDVVLSSLLKTVITHLYLRSCFNMYNAEICLGMTWHINHSRVCLVLLAHNEI